MAPLELTVTVLIGLQCVSTIIRVVATSIGLSRARHKNNSAVHVEFHGNKLDFDNVDGKNIDSVLQMIKSKILAEQNNTHT